MDDEPSNVLQVPAEALRKLMNKPALSTVVLAKMTHRLTALSLLAELPRFAGVDQEAVRDLRTVPAEG